MGISSAILAAVVFSHAICESLSLDGAWEMSYRPNEYGREMRVLPEFSGKMVDNAVPGYWEDMVAAFRESGIADEFRVNPLYEQQSFPIFGRAQDMTLPNIYGCFFYRRKVNLDSGGKAVLAFEGVRNQVHVWINGRFVAFRQGFSTPFEIAIPAGFLKSGKNEIVLAVSNNPNLGYCDFVSGLTTRSIFGATGGINGHLKLMFPKSDIADVYVTTAKDMKSCTVHVTGREPFKYEVVEGERIVRNGSSRGCFSFATDGLEFWSPGNPKLYELRIHTAAGCYNQRFGVRRFVAEGEKYHLNGRPIYLRGVTEHCYFPQTVHLPRDKAYYRMVTAKRKELGFNFVRFHTFVPPVEYLEATDELGMLVHIESPNFVTRQEYAAIVAFARRHPSVVIFCAGNETRIDRLAETYLEDIAGLVHSMTDSLFSPVSAMRGVEYSLSPGNDAVSRVPFAHNSERIGRMARYCDVWTSYQRGATSYESLNGAEVEQLDAWGDAYCGKPRNSHEICIDGSYVDLSVEELYPTNSPILKTGMFTGLRQQFRRRGILDRADLYFRNSCGWMSLIRKYTFEKLRSADRISGFDFLGDINTHWHTFGYSVGMMDEFYRLKPGETVENVLRYNSAAVLLADLGTDFNVFAGSEKRVSFKASNYANEISSAILSVSLVGEDGRSVWSQEMAVGDIPNGKVSKIGDLSVKIPESGAIRKFALKAELQGADMRIANEWFVYAFPKVPDPVPPAGVIVAGAMTGEELLMSLRDGQRVLLLGAGPFKSHPLSFRIGLAGRSAGNYATVIKAGHPLLKGIPHDGWCGWQFRRLMEGGRCVQIEAGVPFDPIIDVASSVKCVIRQSPLFEYRIGEGLLLVCAFAFLENDPAARWMKDRLFAYVASQDFAPTDSLREEDLLAVINAPLISPDANDNSALNLNDYASEVRDGECAQP